MTCKRRGQRSATVRRGRREVRHGMDIPVDVREVLFDLFFEMRHDVFISMILYARGDEELVEM
jgi:hypothetical protein